MAFYEAFFDESDDGKGQKFLAVGGYVIRSEGVKAFEEDWQKTLDEVGIKTFHMKDCAHHNNEFKNKPREALRTQTELIQKIKKHSLFGVCKIAPLSHYQTAEDIGAPYSFLGENCIISIISLLKSCFDPDPKVALFFEQGYKGHKELNDLYNTKPADIIKRHVVSLAFSKKEEVRLLQAADLLSWQAAKHVRNIVTQERKPRKDFLALTEHRHFFSYMLPQAGKILIISDERPGIVHDGSVRLIKDLFSGRPVTEAPLVAFWDQKPSTTR